MSVPVGLRRVLERWSHCVWRPRKIGREKSARGRVERWTEGRCDEVRHPKPGDGLLGAPRQGGDRWLSMVSPGPFSVARAVSEAPASGGACGCGCAGWAADGAGGPGGAGGSLQHAPMRASNSVRMRSGSLLTSSTNASSNPRSHSGDSAVSACALGMLLMPDHHPTASGFSGTRPGEPPGQLSITCWPVC